nr:hypothetical protein [Tanacetum cinerariifolium]
MKDDEQEKQADISIWLSLKIKFERPTPLVKPCRVVVVRKGESSSSQAMDESTPSGACTQEEMEDFNAWLDE